MRCPNCGQEFQGDRCPSCGRPARSSGSRIAAIVILIFLVIPAALFGACSTVVAISAFGEGRNNADSGVAIFALMAVVGIAAFLGSLALVVKLWKG